MKKYLKKIMEHPLFTNIDETEINQMLELNELKLQAFKKDEVILLVGNQISSVGLVVVGSVKVIKEDIEGNSLIIAEIGENEIFAEVFALTNIKQSPVTVVASEFTEIVMINLNKIISSNNSEYSFQQKITTNMLKIIAKKSLLLNQRLELLSKRTIRDKIWCCFEFYSKGNREFILPFNREEMASYLSVDRSALSAELSRMRKEGLIEFNKNRFTILK